MHLEPDEAPMTARRPTLSGQIMLARRKKYVLRMNRLSPTDTNREAIRCTIEPLDKGAAAHVAPRCLGLSHQDLVENATRKRERLKRQSCVYRSPVNVQAHAPNRVSTGRFCIHTCSPKIPDRFSTEESAADFVVSFALLFEQHHFASGGRQPQGQHGAGQAAADNNVISGVAH